MLEEKNVNKETEDLSYLDDTAGMGLENVSFEDMPKPFLRVLQDLSPVCKKGNENYNAEATPGMFMHSISGKLYGNKLNVIPLTYNKVWLEWEAGRGKFIKAMAPGKLGKGTNKGITSDDREIDISDFSHWKTKDGTEIVENYIFYLLLPDFPEDGIVILPLNKSGIKHAQSWISYIVGSKYPSGKQAAFFSSVWTIETILNTDGKNTWYQVGSTKGKTNITQLRWISKVELDSKVGPSLEMISSLKELDYSGISNETPLIEDKSSTTTDPNDPWAK